MPVYLRSHQPSCAVPISPLEVGSHLRLYQHQIDEKHDKIMLDVFIREALATWTLCQSHAFAERAVIGFAVFGVERFDGVAAFDADGHWCRALRAEMVEQKGCGNAEVKMWISFLWRGVVKGRVLGLTIDARS